MLMRQLLLTISASAVLLPSYIRADEGNYTCSCRCCCYGECSSSNEKLVEDCLKCLACDSEPVFTGDSTSELTTTATTVGSNYSTTLRSSDQSTHSSLSICMDKCLNSSRESQCNVPPDNSELIVSLSVLCGALLAAVVILTVACVHRYGCRCRRCWRRKSNPPMLPSISFVDARLSDCRPPSTTPTSDEKCRAGPDDPRTSNNNGSGNTGFSSNCRQLPPVCRTRDEDTDVDLQKKKVSRGSVESEAGSLSGATLLFRNGKYVYEVKKVFERQSDAACSPPVSNKDAKASVSSTKTIGGNGNNSAAAAETGRPSNSITNKVAMLPPSVSRPSFSKPHAIPPVGPSTTSKPSCCPTAGKKMPASENPKPSKSKGENSDSSSGSSSSLEYSYAELPEEVLARQKAFMKSMLTASKSSKPGPTVPRVSPRVSPKKEPKLYINV